MASSIAAITTGTGGIVSTADASGNLNLVSGTTTIVALTSAGIAVTGTLTATGAVTLTTVLPVASGGTGVSTSTGTGANVLGTSPTLTTPVLSGSVTGTYTLAGTPTITSPTITTPTFNSAQLATVVGTAPLYMARAWVKFNGTGTVAITASGNVSSITDRAVGKYTVNFTTAMSDANYCSQANVQKSDTTDDGQIQAQAGGAIGAEQTAGAMPVITLVNVTLIDSPAVFAVAFR